MMRQATKCGERGGHMIVWKKLKKSSFQSDMLDKYNSA